MKLRLLLLLAAALLLLGLGTPATNVRSAPVSLMGNQTAAYLSYFPLVSATNQAGYVTYFPAISRHIIESCCAVPLPAVIWDPRLGPGATPPLDQVRIIPANVAPCQRYWRVVVVKFEDPHQSGNDHTIYVKVLDEYGNRAEGERLHVTLSWLGMSEYPTEKPAGDLCNCNFDFPMFGDAYSVHIDGVMPSDIMANMVMPFKRHVNYRITFQRVLNPG